MTDGRGRVVTDEMGDSRPALLVTCRDGRHPTRAALRRALPGARVRTTAFRDVLRVDAAGDPVALAAQACRVSGAALGRVTAVLEEVPSDRAALLDAAARVGVGQIRPGSRSRSASTSGARTDTPSRPRSWRPRPEPRSGPHWNGATACRRASISPGPTWR